MRVEAVLPWELEKARAFVKAKEYALNENERDLRTAKMNFLKILNLSPMIYTDVVFDDEIIFPEKLPSMEECIYEAVAGNEILQITETGKDISTDIKKIALQIFFQK